MINKFIGVGRLTKDPELRYSQSGIGICNFTIACNRTFKSNDGKDADFINAVCFKKSAEALANFQRKGNLVGIEGRIQTRSYQNNEDRTVYVTEVVCDSVQFLESKNKDNGDNDQDNGSHPGMNQKPDKEPEPTDISDDMLPF